MTSVPDQLEKLVEMLKGGFITPEEFEVQKRALLDRPDPTSSHTPGSDPAMRKEIGAYRLLAFLGEGGMGAVYRGRHRSDEMARRQGGDVSIKVMHAQYARNPEYRTRFEREATLGMRLDHPNIARVHDLIVDGGELALVIQFVAGQALSHVMGAAASPLDWESALTLFEPLLDAVGTAHVHGVIHRDIKPENVLVSDAGVPLIVDFGIAKDQGSAHTRTGTGMGTVEYMAPEQYTDAGSVDHRADIYSLGMVLYEMLAGRLPWEPDTPDFEILEQKARRQLMSPAAFRPGIPREIVAALAPAVAASPDERHGSTEVFRAALDSARAQVLASRRARGTTPEAPSPSPPTSPPPAEPAARDPGEPLRPLSPSSPPALPEQPQPGRAKWWIAAALWLVLFLLCGGGIWAIATSPDSPAETSISDGELERIREREREQIQAELETQAERNRTAESAPRIADSPPRGGGDTRAEEYLRISSGTVPAARELLREITSGS